MKKYSFVLIIIALGLLFVSCDPNTPGSSPYNPPVTTAEVRFQNNTDFTLFYSSSTV